MERKLRYIEGEMKKDNIYYPYYTKVPNPLQPNETLPLEVGTICTVFLWSLGARMTFIGGQFYLVQRTCHKALVPPVPESQKIAGGAVSAILFNLPFLSILLPCEGLPAEREGLPA